MSDKFQDPNWGNRGNPTRKEWYHYARGRSEVPVIFDYSNSDKNIFADKPFHISLSTLFIVIVAIFVISGLSETARGWVFYGINIAEHWYSAVDSLLDALGAPKLP